MKNVLVSYYNYLISNMVNQCNYFERFEINQSDENILEFLNGISNSINEMYNQMEFMGIDVSKLSNESYDFESTIRDFKLKRILKNEGN